MAEEFAAALAARGDVGVLPNAGSSAPLMPRVEGLILRDVRDSDGEAIVELVGTVWSEYPGKVLDARRDMPELLAPASAYRACDGRFWVLEAEDGRIVGSIALKPSAEPGVVELQKLYVAKDARRAGRGAFLCGLVESEARRRGARAIELWSDIKLLDAHRLYERLGYARGSDLKRYDDTSSTVRCYYWKELIGANRGRMDGAVLGDDTDLGSRPALETIA